MKVIFFSFQAFCRLFTVIEVKLRHFNDSLIDKLVCGKL